MRRSVIEMGLHINQTPNFISRARSKGIDVYIIEENKKLSDNPELTRLAKKCFAANHSSYDKIIGYIDQIKRDNNLIGMISFEEDWLKTTAKLNEMYDLPGVSVAAVDGTIDKEHTHRVLSQNGVPTTEYKMARTLEEVENITKEFGYPIVLKPVNKKASRGVLSVFKASDLSSSYEKVREFTDQEELLVEKFIDAKEFSVEGVIVNYGVCILGVTEKFTFPGTNVESIHISPFEKISQQKIWSLIDKVTRLLGITFGPFHIECFDSEQGLIVNEVHTRYGGDNITKITELAGNVDIHTPIIDIFLNENSDYPPVTASVKTAAIAFIAAKSGTVKKIDIQALHKNPVIDYSFETQIGQEVKYPENSYDRLGWFVLSGRDRADVLKKINDINKQILIEVN